MPPHRDDGEKTMKRRDITAVLTTVFLCAGLTARAAGDGWITDFQEAKRLAAEKGLPILADFSGSDWCGWCIKLDREVFSQKAFKDYAKDNVILFLADFPQSRKQPDAVVKQNRELAKRYGVKGYPTVLVLDKDGTVLKRAGYRRGGAEAYVTYLKGVIAEG